MRTDSIEFVGHLGMCGQRRVFLGFGRAQDLCRASFPDVLDEATGSGYQRAFSREHSLEFKKYIQRPGSTSIPLTFNARGSGSESTWLVERVTGESLDVARLTLCLRAGPVMSQVDGQHRLGFLQDSPIPFPFMVFFGLSLQEEIDVFRTINGKAKGLSSSLLDFTEARLLDASLAKVKPELFVALGLNSESNSPWLGRLDLGGQRTVGLHRVASLRTMQQAAKRFIKASRWSDPLDPQAVLEAAIAFWRAIAFVLPGPWAEPRRHLLTKGVGVYALMGLAGMLVRECDGKTPTFHYFTSKLSDFIDQVDWSTTGPLEGYGGAKGADTALEMLLHVRSESYRRLTSHA
jgi:DGQHR domain-containing protein